MDVSVAQFWATQAAGGAGVLLLGALTGRKRVQVLGLALAVHGLAAAIASFYLPILAGLFS